MVSVILIIYLTYMFISIYFMALFLTLFFINKKTIFDYPKPKKKYKVGFLVPAYNEEETIEGTLKKILKVEYDINEIIVINDCSKDNTLKIAKKFAKKHPKIKVFHNEKNLGKAGTLNKALKLAKSELVAVVDADSFPAKDSISKMVGFFDDPKVGAVTCPVLARNKKRFWEKLQSLEYRVISFTRKMLEYADAIYVTPGPLALYRKKALLDIGGFDRKNMTEDIEATWHLAKNNWERKMSLSTYVTSEVPYKFVDWFKQRRRWNIGGLQCTGKYIKYIGRKGILGQFIVPFFIMSLFLGLLGLVVFSYILLRNMITKFLFTQFSIMAGTPLLILEDFYITPSFLNYLGVVLFIGEIIFIFIVLSVLKDSLLKKENLLSLPFYLGIYLVLYPFILIDSIFQYVRGYRKWR